MANIKMPNNFDKILATCRSRGVYCVPILQSLAQLKTLFAEGAWEGIVGNCDTFIYLGGNEASTYEYVSKLLGKWTIDKRTSGESKGSSGSYSQNYDVLGRELMLEYELRLLPDDECIIFVRGENPIRDKKWFPWEHEQYLKARKCGTFNPKEQQEKQEKPMEECEFLGEESLNYLKLQKDKNENIRLYELDAFSFMMMDLDEMEKKKRIFFERDFIDDIRSSVLQIAKKYRCNKEHNVNVTRIACQIFDKTKKIHGLKEKEKLQLEIAATLHDCGKFINMNNAGENSYAIIMSTEIMGLSHKEREEIANIVKYNSLPFPDYREIQGEIGECNYMTIAKLVAILRVANAMDRSHKQKASAYNIVVKDKQLLITIDTLYDLTLERGLFTDKAEFFELVYGIKPVLKQKRSI